jgi:hypothetical protein
MQANAAAINMGRSKRFMIRLLLNGNGILILIPEKCQSLLITV